MQRDIPHGYEPFIKDFFRSLDCENISYVVLRNYDNLPIEPGHDIDLLVEPGFLKTAGNILRKSAERFGWVFIQEIKRYGFRKFIFIYGTDNHHTQYLIWDIMDRSCWMGFSWMDTELAIETRKYDTRGFYIPSPGIEAAILLIKDLIQVGTINRKHCTRIHTMMNMELNLFTKGLRITFGEEITKSIQNLVEQEDWEGIEREFVHLRETLVKKSIQKQPARTFLHFLQFIYGHIGDYIRGRYSLLICFIGPDGSGKTTVSSNLLVTMKDIFDEIQYYHSFYGLLPKLANIIPSQIIPSQYRSEGLLNKPDDNNLIPIDSAVKKRKLPCTWQLWCIIHLIISLAIC